MPVTVLRSLWVEPRPDRVPVPGLRDGALIAVLVGWSGLEVVLRTDLAPWPLLLVVVSAVCGPLWWRHAHPLAAVLVPVVTLTLVDVVRVVSGTSGTLLSSGLAVLIGVYALLRWGSGRQALVGLGVVLLWPAATAVVGADPVTVVELAAGYALFLCAAALGAAVRYRAKIRLRDVDQARTREREQLARELHDTVAHHVSGIAIQAQAGRAVAMTHPELAVEALAVIEEAATRTLTELRAIVGVLRDPQDAEFAPQPGLAEITQLADHRSRPRVEVTVAGEFDELSPGVGAALFRLAQEAVTNARRHARHATVVAVVVTEAVDEIRLTVSDDGAAVGHRGTEGFGLVGMGERAALLGGTFQAGPAAGQGWRVEAVLPRSGVTQ